MKRATSSLALLLSLSFIAAGCGARGSEAPGPGGPSSGDPTASASPASADDLPEGVVLSESEEVAIEEAVVAPVVAAEDAVALTGSSFLSVRTAVEGSLASIEAIQGRISALHNSGGAESSSELINDDAAAAEIIEAYDSMIPALRRARSNLNQADRMLVFLTNPRRLSRVIDPASPAFVRRQRTIVASLNRANRSLSRLHREAAGNAMIQLIESELATLITQAQDSLTEMNSILSHAAPVEAPASR